MSNGLEVEYTMKNILNILPMYPSHKRLFNADNFVMHFLITQEALVA